MTPTAVDLENGWRLAESRAPSHEDAVVGDALEARIGERRIFVGVDSAGTRHLLLPLSEEADLPPSASGAAVRIAARSLTLDHAEGLFADVSCTRADLFAEFAVLSAEIVAEVDEDPSSPAETAAHVVERWRELLRAISPPALNRSALIGLFAELLVLERVLAEDPRMRSDCWTGPRRGRHDFQRGAVVLDVKGSTARHGRPVVIHGIDQLESPPNAELYLWWIHLETGVGRGRSLRALVHELLDRVTDPRSLEHELRQVGYDFDSEESYDSPLLTELESRLYHVDDSFPRLTRAHLATGDLPARVIAVRYEIDLSGDDPPSLAEQEVANVVRTLGGTR